MSMNAPTLLSLLIAPLLLACAPEPEPHDKVDPGPTTGSTTDTGSLIASWDPTPQSWPRGSMARFEIDCGLLVGTPVREFRKLDDTGTDWQMIFPATPDVQEGVIACTRNTQDYMGWHETGFIEVLSSDLYHEMFATGIPNRWLGTAEPESGSNPSCDEALANLGLSWPVSLTMTLLEVVEP